MYVNSNPPVGYTCNSIDSAIERSKSISEAVDGLEELAAESRNAVDHLIVQLEKLRSENEKLRNWGDECYRDFIAEERRAEELEREVETWRNLYEDAINELEQKGESHEE
jgi:chromosome segregation ATPase